ncbi:MAG: hypothetical protein ABI990_06395, partial [Actinomycetota bacterium]
VAEPQIPIRTRLNLGRIRPRGAELDDLPKRRRPGDAQTHGHEAEQHYGERRGPSCHEPNAPSHIKFQLR